MPGAQHLLAFVGHERELALDHEHELVLPPMPMAKRRGCARLEPRQVHAEGHEPERVAERALGASGRTLRNSSVG